MVQGITQGDHLERFSRCSVVTILLVVSPGLEDPKWLLLPSACVVRVVQCKNS